MPSTMHGVALNVYWNRALHRRLVLVLPKHVGIGPFRIHEGSVINTKVLSLPPDDSIGPLTMELPMSLDERTRRVSELLAQGLS